MYGQDHNEVIRQLEACYPRCFFDDARQRRPIKKNVVTDIEAQKPKELEPYHRPPSIGTARIIGITKRWRRQAISALISMASRSIA